MALLSSPWGHWAVQTLLHSAVALFVIDGIMAVWQVHDPRARFRLRLAVLLLPPIIAPLSQLASSVRGDFWFRQDWALLDSHRWFVVEVFGVSLGAILLTVVGGGTSLLVLFQEILPVVRDLRRSRGPRSESRELPHLTAMIAELVAELGIAAPGVRVFRSKRPILLTTGGTHPSVLISESLLERLSPAQMRAALGHELAHIERRSNFTTLVIFFVRLVSFFNPISLLVFRHMLQDDEHVCDDRTIELTGDRDALADALELFKPRLGGKRSAQRVLEDHSHTTLLTDRIARLRNPILEDMPPANPVPIAVFTIIGLCFFIV